ncbi:MAG TPA: hypothetical protein VF244_05835 [Acidimicrobiales bacterium]
MTARRSLARVEAYHLLRSPAVLISLALTMPLLALGPGSDDSFVRYKVLAGAGCAVLAVGTGVAAALAAARTRRSGTAELFGSLPVGASDVTSAHLLSVGVALLPAVVVLVALAGRLQVWDGLAVPELPGLAEPPDPDRLTPSVVALAQGPLVVVLAGVAGVAVGLWVRSSLASTLVLFLGGYLLPLPMLWWSWDWRRWLVPLAHGLDVDSVLGGPQGTVLVVHGVETAAMGWHLLYLLGLIAVVAAIAHARSRPGQWARFLPAGGVAVGAGAVQVVTAR